MISQNYKKTSRRKAEKESGANQGDCGEGIKDNEWKEPLDATHR
jgi:hypothetical protein